jgi:hypothetical protein
MTQMAIPKFNSTPTSEQVRQLRAEIEQRPFRQENGKQPSIIRAFITFVVELPHDKFETCVRGGGNAR